MRRKTTAKKKFYQRKWFIVLMAILVIGIIGGALGGNEDDTQSGTDNQTNESDNAQAEADSQTNESDETYSETQEQSNSDSESGNNTGQSGELSAEMFVEDVKTAIKGAVNSSSESIIDVIFENGDLCVYVDFSQTDPSPLTLEDLALSRTSSITDEILELTQYETLWDTITIDFGDLGYIRNSKEDMQNSGYGNYFPAENFTLE